MAALYAWDGGTAWALLALALRRDYGLENLPEAARLPKGKPWFPAYPQIQFNLSHSGPLSLCGVGDAPLGVDIERIRIRRPGLPRRVLSETEYAWFEARGSRWADFCALWTLKESRCKYTGRGLDVPSRTLAVPPLDPGETGELDGLLFRAYGGEGWRAAACTSAPGDLPERIHWMDSPEI